MGSTFTLPLADMKRVHNSTINIPATVPACMITPPPEFCTSSHNFPAQQRLFLTGVKNKNSELKSAKCVATNANYCNYTAIDNSLSSGASGNHG